MNVRHVTATGARFYFGLKPFVPGRLVRCVKEPGNIYDAEAIRVVMPAIGTVGYLANRPETLVAGTMSAGRVYDSVQDCFFARVAFVTWSLAICRVEEGAMEELEAEFLGQTLQEEGLGTTPTA